MAETLHAPGIAATLLSARLLYNPRPMSPATPRCEQLDACPVCRSTGLHERLSSPDLLLSVPGTFRYVECSTCRTVFQNPRVRDEDLPLCYEGDYNTRAGGGPWAPTPAPRGSLRDRLRRAIRSAAEGGRDDSVSPPLRLAGMLLALHPSLRRRARLGLVDGLEPPEGRPGRCLEVGPGQGVDLFGLRALGWEAFGLDLDPHAAEVARRTSGCEVRVGTLATTDYPPGSFDLVYLCHVFEHLPDPAAALARCHDLLVPGGRLLLICPNPRALTTWRYGPLSLVWDPPRHLVLPPAPAILALLTRAGFEGPRARTFTWNVAGLAEAARRRRRGTPWSPLRLPPPSLPARTFAVAEFLLVALGWPVGEEIQVCARKPQAAGSGSPPGSSS